jgi:pimeloyl-ACP methyl ester carboxylesterase
VPSLEERFTTHEGGRLRYLVGGSGPPMLLCHGFIGSAENFDDWFSALLPRRTIVVPDLPGFGRSAPLRGPHTAATLAGAVLSAAADAGIERFDLAGLCLGSCVALAVQRQRPGAVQRVILHTPLLAPRLVRWNFHAQLAVMLAPGVYPGIVWLAHQRVVSDLYKRLMVEGSDVDQRLAQINFDNQMLAAPRAAREWLRDGLRRDDVAQLRDGSHRVMIVVAGDDRIAHVPRLAEVCGRIANVDIAVVAQGGHAWTDAMSRRQRELIAAFLDDLPLPQESSAIEAA